MNRDLHRQAATCIGDLPQLLFESRGICRRGNRQVFLRAPAARLLEPPEFR